MSAKRRSALRLILVTPSPSRGLALEPADGHKQHRKSHSAGDVSSQCSSGREEQGVPADESYVRGQDRPALPGQRKAPTPAVAFRREPVTGAHGGAHQWRKPSAKLERGKALPWGRGRCSGGFRRNGAGSGGALPKAPAQVAQRSGAYSSTPGASRTTLAASPPIVAGSGMFSSLCTRCVAGRSRMRSRCASTWGIAFRSQRSVGQSRYEA